MRIKLQQQKNKYTVEVGLIFYMFDKYRRYIEIDVKIRYSICENLKVRYIESIEVFKL